MQHGRDLSVATTGRGAPLLVQSGYLTTRSPSRSPCCLHANPAATRLSSARKGHRMSARVRRMVMGRRKIGIAASVAALSLAASASPAGAAVTIGQLAPGTPPPAVCNNGVANDWVQPTVTSGNSYVVARHRRDRLLDSHLLEPQRRRRGGAAADREGLSKVGRTQHLSSGGFTTGRARSAPPP